IYVHDRDPDGNGVYDEGNGVTTLVSIDGEGNPADQNCWAPSISADGSRVAFMTDGPLRPDYEALVHQVYLRAPAAGATLLVSADSSGAPAAGCSYAPAISADGTKVVFVSGAANLVDGDTNGADDVFVRDLASGTITRVSVDSAGMQGDGGYWGGTRVFEY